MYAWTCAYIYSKRCDRKFTIIVCVYSLRVCAGVCLCDCMSRVFGMYFDMHTCMWSAYVLNLLAIRIHTYVYVYVYVYICFHTYLHIYIYWSQEILFLPPLETDISKKGTPNWGGGVSCDQHIYATDDDNAMWILLCIYIDMYIYVMCMSIVCVFMCTCVLMDVGIINICMYICTHTQSYIYVYTNRCQRNADTVIAISRFCYAWL